MNVSIDKNHSLNSLYQEILLKIGSYDLPLRICSGNSLSDSVLSYEIVTVLKTFQVWFWALTGGQWRVSTSSPYASNFLSNLFAPDDTQDCPSQNVLMIREIDTDKPNVYLLYLRYSDKQLVLYATALNLSATFLDTVGKIPKLKNYLSQVTHKPFFDISNDSKSIFLPDSDSQSLPFDQTMFAPNPFIQEKLSTEQNPFLVAISKDPDSTPVLQHGKNSLSNPSISRRSSSPLINPKSGDDSATARQKQALQHLVLAALRLRGVTRDTLGSEEYKELYHHTFRAAQFAVAQRARAAIQRKDKDRSENGKCSLSELQDIVDKLLNLFLPDL